MKINCHIRNNDPTNHPHAVVRKLYQVFFWQDNFKEIHLFTGIVLGDVRKPLSTSFGFSIEYSIEDDNLFETLISDDNTSKFNKEPKGWQAVWGKDGSLLERLEDFKTAYCSLNSKTEAEYDSLFTPAITNALDFNNNTFLKIISKHRVDAEYKSLVIGVKGEITNTAKSVINIKQQVKDLPGNVEVINWHETKITLKDVGQKNLKKINEIEYSLGFTRTNNSDQCACPDITYYIVLPDKYDMDLKKSTLEVNKKNGTNEIVSNHLQEIQIKKEENYFYDWPTHYNILNRSYYQLSKNRELLSSDQNLQFKFKIDNKVSSLYTQLVWALLASIVIAYGLDFTRLSFLKDYFLFFPELNYVLLLVPITLALTPYFVNRILNRDLFNDVKNNIPLKLALAFSAVWFILVFGVGGYNSYTPIHLGMGLKEHFITACKSIYIIAFLLNFFAVFYPHLKRKKWYKKFSSKFRKRANA